MWHHQRHPSDHTLLLAVDRELSVPRQLALDRHLSHCARCRARSTMASLADEASRLCRRGETAISTTALRRRLQADMTELGARWDRSVSFRMRRALTALPFVVRVGADNWIAAYRRYLRTDQPLARRADAVDEDDERPSDRLSPAVFTTSRSSSAHIPLRVAFAGPLEAEMTYPTRNGRHDGSRP